MTRLREWARRHQHDARGAARTILDQKWSSLSTWGAMGIALGLPIFLFSFLSQLADYEGQWQGQAKVSVYLIEAASCLLYTSPSPRDRTRSRMPSSA